MCKCKRRFYLFINLVCLCLRLCLGLALNLTSSAIFIVIRVQFAFVYYFIDIGIAFIQSFNIIPNICLFFYKQCVLHTLKNSTALCASRMRSYHVLLRRALTLNER